MSAADDAAVSALEARSLFADLTDAQALILDPDLPEWFCQIVEKLLAKKPADRFQSAREVADVLEHFWALLKSSETPVCPKKKAANVWKAVSLGTAAGLLTLVVGALGIFYFLPRGENTEGKIPAPLHLFKGDGEPLWSMAVSNDGKHLVVGANIGASKPP